jgi:hypothetical protein
MKTGSRADYSLNDGIFLLGVSSQHWREQEIVRLDEAVAMEARGYREWLSNVTV